MPQSDGHLRRIDEEVLNVAEVDSRKREVSVAASFVGNCIDRADLAAKLKVKNIAVVLRMRSSHLLKKAATALLISATLAPVAFADPSNAQCGDKYVFVTGSMIPQKVKVKSIGTATVSPLRVITRREIYQSGRYTTEGVLALEPSLQVRSGHIVGN
jgi:hypothetical protein